MDIIMNHPTVPVKRKTQFIVYTVFLEYTFVY